MNDELAELAAMLRKAAEDEPVISAENPHPEAQRMELVQRFARLTEPSENLVPGDIVYEKPGIGMLKHHKGRPLLVLRPLDETRVADRTLVRRIAKSSSCLSDYDLLVAFLAGDIHAIVVLPHHSGALTRVRPGEDE